MKVFFAVAAGVLVAVVVVFIGCAAILGSAGNEAVKEIDRQERKLERENNRSAITNRQARSIPIGTTRAQVKRRLGRPLDTTESDNDFADSSCMTYNVKNSAKGAFEVPDTWVFCFEGTGPSGTLTSKDRY